MAYLRRGGGGGLGALAYLGYTPPFAAQKRSRPKPLRQQIAAVSNMLHHYVIPLPHPIYTLLALSQTTQ